MDKNDINVKLISKISELCENYELEILLSSQLVDIGFNSISFIKMLVFAEQEFGIEIDDERLILENYHTVFDLINMIYTSIDINMT